MSRLGVKYLRATTSMLIRGGFSGARKMDVSVTGRGADTSLNVGVVIDDFRLFLADFKKWGCTVTFGFYPFLSF